MATEELKALEAQGLTELTACADEAALKTWFDKFLGAQGLWKAAFAKMSAVPKDQKAAFGAEGNRVKAALTAVFEKARAEAKERTLELSLTTNPLDAALPGRAPRTGRLHPLTQARRHVGAIFAELGFQVCRAREGAVIEGALRDAASKPIRTLLVGPSEITGLVVTEGATLADLKGALTAFAARTFDAERRVRFRGSFTPLTEPSVAFDIEDAKCDSGWSELIVGGMLRPTVLLTGGYNPDAATGFAFTLSVERVLMLAHGIEDAGLFRQNDLRFLKQF